MVYIYPKISAYQNCSKRTSTNLFCSAFFWSCTAKRRLNNQLKSRPTS